MIASNKRHFLESKSWGKFQNSLGNKTFSRSGEGWEYIAILEKQNGKIGSIFTRLYLPYGPAYKDSSSLKNALADCEALAKENGVTFIRVEPLAYDLNNAFSKLKGYQKTKRNFQPMHTLIIDLDRPFDEILKETTKSRRYRWSRLEKDNVSFKISYESKDLEPFFEMINRTQERTQAKLRAKDYYIKMLDTLGPEKVAGIAYAQVANKPLTGAIFIDDDISSTRYYLYAGSLNEARELDTNSSLLVFLIKDAHDKGLKYFDLFGVAPADAGKEHKWAGFSAFKRSFGGEEVKYNGTWEKPINKTKFQLVKTIRKISR